MLQLFGFMPNDLLGKVRTQGYDCYSLCGKPCLQSDVLDSTTSQGTPSNPRAGSSTRFFVESKSIQSCRKAFLHVGVYRVAFPVYRIVLFRVPKPPVPKPPVPKPIAFETLDGLLYSFHFE